MILPTEPRIPTSGLPKNLTIALRFGLALASVHLAEAQQPGKIARIGYLTSAEPALDPTRVEAIRLGSGRAWPHRRTEHHHRIPICRGKVRTASRACGRASATQG